MEQKQFQPREAEMSMPATIKYLLLATSNRVNL